jgi:acetylornithine deacetylase/succinyl-diaminopimelate desuccinylase-like protein
MHKRILAATLLAVSAPVCAPQLAPLQLNGQDRQLSRDIFQQLININSTDSVGSVTAVATAIRQRLLAAGFPATDLMLTGPNDRKQNLVVTYHGKPGGSLKPLLVICHIDVVEARREDWTTDPFVFTEKDGFFYGRGTQDIKEADAALVYSLLKMKRDHFVPNRDLVVAFTADEEGGQSNGVDWLIKNHPSITNAEFVINPDSGGVYARHGVPSIFDVEATEKTYADFHVTALNKGGHSSLPVPDNAIYHLANGLAALERSPFPFELNAITRAEIDRMSTIETGTTAADMRAVLAQPMDKSAAERLAKDANYNSILRTTCVATMITAGHAPNALPQKAQANVNCRILPGHSAAEVRNELIKIFNDPTLDVQYVNDAGMQTTEGIDRVSQPPPPVNPTFQAALNAVVNQLWPKLPILPTMEAGASDSIYTMAAGLPSYGFNGFTIDEDDVRAHGKDERLGVESYFKGVEFTYLFLTQLTSK